MIIFRYLAREILLSTFAVSMILTLVFISTRFARYLSKAASGLMSSDILFTVIVCRLTMFMELIIPLAFLIYMLLAMGRLYAESEMIVMQACGVSKRRLLAYTMVPAGLMTALVASFSLYLSPMGLQKYNELWSDPSNFSGLGTLMGGRFQKLPNNLGVSYVQDVDDENNQMQRVFLVIPSQQAEKSDVIVMAEQGKVFVEEDGKDRYIELSQGVRYDGNAGELDFQVTEFGRYLQKVIEPEAELPAHNADARDTQELLQSDDLKDQAALQWRISVPFMIPVITFIAITLGETNHRRGRFIKLLPGVVVYILYVAALSFCRGALEKGQLPVELGLWWIHGLFILFGIYLWQGPAIRHQFKRNRSAGAPA